MANTALAPAQVYLTQRYTVHKQHTITPNDAGCNPTSYHQHGLWQRHGKHTLQSLLNIPVSTTMTQSVLACDSSSAPEWPWSVVTTVGGRPLTLMASDMNSTAISMPNSSPLRRVKRLM